MDSHLSGNYLTIEDVVALFPGRSRGAIYTERHKGVGLGAIATQVGNRLYWRAGDVDRWFDEQMAREASTASARRV